MLSRRIFLLAVFFWFLVFGLHSKTYIVAIGVNDYSRFPGKCSNLALPVNDAVDFAAIYPNNAKVEKTVLTNAKATRSNIIKAMNDLYSKAGRNDEVIFYFSGHGDSGGVCAYDGVLSFAMVREAMGKSKAVKKLIFSDSCQAGGIKIDAKKAARAQKQAKKSDVMMMMASRENEYSSENPRMRNGYFTHFLIHGLKGKADTNNDKTVTAKELFDYVHTGVIKATRGRQHPIAWGNFPADMSLVKRK